MTAVLEGDHATQTEVLEGLATAVNHRQWFVELALPYLGDDPIEIGSGLGDYAEAWAAHVPRFTATEASHERLIALKERFGGDSSVAVTEMFLPSPDAYAEHSAAVSYNVLEHIEDHVGALRTMGRLVRPGGAVILIVPAFEFAMSPVDIATGHVRRYTKATMASALTEAGLRIERLQYANALGLIGYYVTTSLLRMAPKEGPLVSFYDRIVLPLTKAAESRVRPPFGQSVFAVARTPH